jgi:hypothetical protein
MATLDPSRRRALTTLLRWVHGGVALGGGWVAMRARAQTGVDEAEYRIKAAFLCKFGHYVEWPAPATPGAPFEIGVVADDAVFALVQRAARGQLVQTRPVAVRRLTGVEPLDGLSVVFVAASQASRLTALLEAARGKPILTVAEADPTGDVGVMVNFVVVGDKVKFDIAPHQAERSQLKISARLLDVARHVHGRSS